MKKKMNKELSAQTEADSRTNADNLHVSQHSRKPNVSSIVLERVAYDVKRDRSELVAVYEARVNSSVTSSPSKFDFKKLLSCEDPYDFN